MSMNVLGTDRSQISNDSFLPLLAIDTVRSRPKILKQEIEMTTSLPTRRYALRAVMATLALPFTSSTFAQPEEALLEVWKSPDCGCCKDWVSHLEANGFRTKVHDVGNTAMRAKLGIPVAYGSCHTARIDGYVIEGHVPASDIRRLLRERPEAIGLTVPGMPIGSPGMDGAVYGGRHDPYDVLLVEKGGGATVYRSYR